MPVILVDISIKEYLQSSGFSHGTDPYGLGLKYMHVAKRILQEHLNKIRTDLVVEDYSDDDNCLAFSIRGKNLYLASLEEMIEEGFSEIILDAEREFQEIVEDNVYEKIYKAPLSELPLLLDKLTEPGTKKLMEARLNDPIAAIKAAAERSRTTKEFVKEIKIIVRTMNGNRRYQGKSTSAPK